MFVRLIKRNVARHAARCPEYARILQNADFSAEQIQSAADLYKIPPVPTLFLKNRTLLSVSEKNLLFKSTTSGTSGKVSVVGLDPLIWKT